MVSSHSPEVRGKHGQAPALPTILALSGQKRELRSSRLGAAVLRVPRGAQASCGDRASLGAAPLTGWLRVWQRVAHAHHRCSQGRGLRAGCGRPLGARIPSTPNCGACVRSEHHAEHSGSSKCCVERSLLTVCLPPAQPSEELGDTLFLLWATMKLKHLLTTSFPAAAIAGYRS